MPSFNMMLEATATPKDTFATFWMATRCLSLGWLHHPEVSMLCKDVPRKIKKYLKLIIITYIYIYIHSKSYLRCASRQCCTDPHLTKVIKSSVCWTPMRQTQPMAVYKGLVGKRIMTKNTWYQCKMNISAFCSLTCWFHAISLMDFIKWILDVAWKSLFQCGPCDEKRWWILDNSSRKTQSSSSPRAMTSTSSPLTAAGNAFEAMVWRPLWSADCMILNETHDSSIKSSRFLHCLI